MRFSPKPQTDWNEIPVRCHQKGAREVRGQIGEEFPQKAGKLFGARGQKRRCSDLCPCYIL